MPMKYNPKRNLQVVVTEETKVKLREMAKKNQRPVSGYVNSILEEFIKNNYDNIVNKQRKSF